MAVLNERIRERREALGLSQSELAKLLGYSDRSTIAKIESGINDITQSKIEAFAQALQTTPAYLMGWDKGFTNLQAEVSVLSLVREGLNLPQGAVFIEGDTVRVEQGYERLLPPGWEQYLSDIRRLVDLNFPISPQNSGQEWALFTKFKSLNDDGKEKLLERADELLELPKYRMDGTTPNTPAEGK